LLQIFLCKYYSIINTIFDITNILSFILKIRAEKKRLKKLAYEQHLKEERIKAYKEFLAKEEQSKRDKQELKKWEMMQIFKTNEANREFYKQRHEKNIKDIEETRKSYQKQIVSLCLYMYVTISIHFIDVHKSADSNRVSTENCCFPCR
jgi:hypothetical protein